MGPSTVPSNSRTRSSLGQDPVAVFFALGAFVIALIVMLLIRESVWRLGLHGALVGLLVLGVLWLTEEVGMPPLQKEVGPGWACAVGQRG